MEEITASSLLFSPSNPDLLLPADHPGSPVRRSAPDRPWLVLIPPHLKIPSLLLSAHTVFSSPPPSTPCLGSPVTATSTRRMITSALTGSCSMNSATSVRLHPIPATPATPPTPMLTIDRPDAGHNRVSDPDRRLDWGRTPCAGTPWPRRGPAGVSPGTAGPSRPDGAPVTVSDPEKDRIGGILAYVSQNQGLVVWHLTQLARGGREYHRRRRHPLRGNPVRLPRRHLAKAPRWRRHHPEFWEMGARHFLFSSA